MFAPKKATIPVPVPFAPVVIFAVPSVGA